MKLLDRLGRERPGLEPGEGVDRRGLTMPAGGLNWAIGSPLLISVRIADQSGADVSSESLPSLGVVSLLPIQTPTASAGAFGSSGGARKP